MPSSLPRPHPLARAPIVERANTGLGKAWQKGWLPEPLIDADDLWENAAKKFGSDASHFETSGRQPDDVADFRLRLAHLTTSIQAEANLNPLGRAMAHGQLVRAIRQRLMLGECWSTSPQAPTTTIAPPIIVIGHMRSGTTRIHRLLAADPAHSATRYCDSYHPVPASEPVRKLRGALDLTMMRRINPWIDAIHPMQSGKVEEELGWLACALNHSIYQTQWHVPAFSAWSETRDPAPVYREFARILRTDAAHRDNAHRPRVMKVPQFSEDLASLLAQFPDARLVIARRDHDAVLRSAISLVANQMAIQCDTCDLDWIEAEWRRKLALRDARVEQALASWNGPIAHLEFDALNTDWESEMARTYKALDLDLSPAALTAMHAEMSASEGGHHHAHAEQLAEFQKN